MRNMHVHTRRKDSDINEYVYADAYEEPNTEENLTRSVEKDYNVTDDTYVNMDTIIKENEITRSMKKEASITKSRIILAALILLIIMFLGLVAFTSLLVKYYLAMSKEISQLKNSDLAMSKEISQLKNSDLAMSKEISQLKNSEMIYEECPSGWKKIGVNCYYFSRENMVWEKARDDCIRKGSSLALPKTKEETDALKPYLEVGKYWIGLRRDTAPKVWIWLDGSVMSFSKWNVGEPNNKWNTEDCVEYLNGSWNDESCTSNIEYICQK